MACYLIQRELFTQRDFVMMLCKKCNQVTARVITKRDLSKLSKSNYIGPAVAAATVLAAKTGGSGIASVAANAAKAATKGPKELLITAGITLALSAAGVGVKYLFSKRTAGDKTYAYCAKCGHYEPMA
ncbi:hypothetical protein GYM96_19840 [Pseudomonas fragi]|uniref:hypothetical protein n=1 Tax=Pseudomonas TaxID=286 RepID=UPI000E738243|nr:MULTISPECIES: hypothetical protein [Pseudomonas]AOA05357.1 hypothetical protein BFC21_06005 [Pseudomonas sp. TMW 2.1634]MBM1202033.1 hypothetical protein [Pseudomonas fragi]